MSRRAQIRMGEDEVAAFLAEHRVVICATNGRDGWPHLMPLWYLMLGQDVWAWTYAKSQKVRNLERDPRATLQLEAGEAYHELRGVMIEAHVVIHRDPEEVAEVGAYLFERYASGGSGGAISDPVRAQAAKRVALQFVPHSVASWDHRKLGRIY